MFPCLSCGRKALVADPADKTQDQLALVHLPQRQKELLQPKLGVTWRFTCTFVDGVSPQQLSQMPVANKSFDVHAGEELVLGRTHRTIQNLLASCPDYSKFISRAHAEIRIDRETSSASVMTTSWNPLFVGERCITSSETCSIDHDQTFSFARPDRDGRGSVKFLTFRAQDPLLKTNADMDDAMTTMLLRDEVPPAHCAESLLTRWGFTCVMAEPFTETELAELPLDTRTLRMTDGTMFMGRRHQPEFFGGVLVRCPVNLKYISRTHAELGIWREGRDSCLLITNRSPNFLFVGSKALGKNETCPLMHEQVLSFARPHETDEGMLVRFLQIRIHDTLKVGGGAAELMPPPCAHAVEDQPTVLAIEDLRPATELNKSAPPLKGDSVEGKDGFTTVFTRVQGAASLRAASPDAMGQAQGMHDRTLREVLAKHGGYEVTTDSDAFQLAFHDTFDAIMFCLECQVPSACRRLR